MKVVGEPDEGKPHVRFEVAGDENQNMVRASEALPRKRGATEMPSLHSRRHRLTLPADGRGGQPLRGLPLRPQLNAKPLGGHFASNDR